MLWGKQKKEQTEGSSSLRRQPLDGKKETCIDKPAQSPSIVNKPHGG